MVRVLCALVLVLFLGACGGAGDSDLLEGVARTPDVQPHGYSRPGYLRPTYPYLTGSNAFTWGDQVHIGGDVEPKEKLRETPNSAGDITVYMGASRDGVGVARLENFDYDLRFNSRSTSGDRFAPFKVRPRLWIDVTLPLDMLDEVYSSVAILNDALPPEFQIGLAGFFGPDDLDALTLGRGNLLLLAGPPAAVGAVCGEGAAACAIAPILKGWSSVVVLPDDLDSKSYRTSRTIILHEMIHALGVWGHVDSIEFPDSIMGTFGDFFPSPGFVLHRIDREILQIMYMSQRTQDYNDWGEWSDTTLHLAGRSEDGMVNFGTALFNGLPQPWARGTLPDRDLEDNYLLRGSATWTGLMLGFSGVSAIQGDTSLTVDLDTLEGDLGFHDIFFINRDGDDSWFPVRDIDYDIEVIGNGFRNTNGEGFVVGSFLGPRHEGMGGTVKRTDLVGAFGGKR